MKTIKIQILCNVLFLILSIFFFIYTIGTLDYHKVEASFSNVTSARDLNHRSMKMKYSYKMTWEYLGETQSMWVRETETKPKTEIWVSADGSDTSLDDPRQNLIIAVGLLCIQVAYLVKLFYEMHTARHAKKRKKRK